MPDLPREGAKNHKHEHTVTLGPGCGWTMYPGPMLNVRDQHSQSGFHSIPPSLNLLTSMVDDMWHYAGDQSTDVSALLRPAAGGDGWVKHFLQKFVKFL